MFGSVDPGKFVMNAHHPTDVLPITFYMLKTADEVEFVDVIRRVVIGQQMHFYTIIGSIPIWISDQQLDNVWDRPIS